jgi:UDPglucose--hexose-1-phosphate uridylyltransferase
MPTLRRDPVTGRWVINPDDADAQASSLVQMEELIKGGLCPFCEGNEKHTPSEIFAIRSKGSQKDGPGWEVRVVPNISPALRVELDPDRRAERMYDLMNAVGAHEVIIETPQHTSNLADLEISQIQKVLQTYRQRISDLKKDQRIRSVFVFKNYGERAGSSAIEHAHSQLIGVSVTPKSLKEELSGAKDYYDYKERCVYCDMIKQELSTEKRLICSNPDFLAFAPFASRFTHEAWILPKKHSADFESLGDDKLENLAAVLKETLQRLKILLNDPPYNCILHTGPNRTKRKGYTWKTLDKDYHWHIEIMPRYVRIDGFEWGTGLYINATTPEQAAESLRKVKIQELT